MKTIEVKYSDVQTAVLRLSEYIGTKAGAYDKLRAIDTDADQLKYWFYDGLSLVGVLLDRVIGRAVSIDSTTDTATIYFLTANDNFALVQDAIVRLIASHIITRWLQLVAPQLLEMYVADYKQAEQALLQLCYFREMPR